MVFEQINFAVQGEMDFPLPQMFKVKQQFSSQQIMDIVGETMRTLKKLDSVPLAGKRIAITAGSRRIANLTDILRVTVEYLRGRGAEPFIVPSMGSHGGANAEGQTELLANLGITEKSVGAPVISSMEVVQIGILKGGCPIYCSETAFSADGIIVCARIKPHTSIRGNIESGLCKMMMVGLGKHRGAAAFHRQGYHRLSEILPQGGRIFLEKTKIICGLGIVENAFDQTLCIEAVMPEMLLEREAELLNIARQNMPQFYLDEIDVLVVDLIGKDISGAGMDPNITGRSITPLPMSAPVPIHCIVALDLTDASHGNATGIGGADITTRRLVGKIDFSPMYTNVLTSGALAAARLPVVLNNDKEAVHAAIRCAARERPENVKVVHIKDTLHLGEIEVSENYLPLIEKEPRLKVLRRIGPLAFDNAGRILSAVS